MVKSLSMKTFLVCISFISFSHALSDSIFKYTAPKSILRLYQLMKDVHDLCERKKIEYYIDAGTLLGAVRHQGIIPWDTNINICVNTHFDEQLAYLKPYIKKLGYRIKQMSDFGYRITSKDVFLDICMVETTNDKIHYQAELMKKTYGYNKRGRGPLYYAVEELYPLKRYKFGQMQVWGPQNPYPYLNAYYGQRWEQYAQMLLSPEENIWSPKEIKLCDADKSPAHPTGPLGHRVDALFSDK